MFNTSKYTNWYFSILEKYKTEKSPLSEQHHIIPKCCGGDNSKSNLVYIPCRIHFLAHKLLTKMIDDPVLNRKMHYSFWRMMNPQSKKHNRTYKITSHDYERERSYFIRDMSGNNNPMKRPEIAAKFSHKRPEQSAVATKRNLEYWKDKKLPILNLICVTCGDTFQTNSKKRICCDKKCAAKYRVKMRRLGDKERLDPHSI